MPVYCSNCGTPSAADGAKFCRSCGATMGDTVQPTATSRQGYGSIATQRTESTVVQVSPDYENDKILEMEMFGWNLQGRQEIHQEGDAYGRPSYIDSSTYVIKTKVSHYVKLHFTRHLSLPNLQKTRGLEGEYFSLPFIQPPSLIGPIIFTVFGIIGGIMCLVMISQPGGAQTFPSLIVSLVWIGLGLRWIRSRRKKQAIAQATNHTSVARMEEIRREVTALLNPTYEAGDNRLRSAG